MDLGDAIGVLANFAVLVGLIIVGFRLFAQYHSRGKWAKNITALLAGTGLLVSVPTALAGNPEAIRRSGPVLVAAALGEEYDFTDVDGRRPRPLTLADV